MDWFVRFAYTPVLYTLLPAVCAIAWYRLKQYQAPVYTYSLAGLLQKKGLGVKTHYRVIFSISRFLVLIALVFLIARPQLVDEQSKVMVEGIDIMMALDVSGSMQLFDDPQERKQRVEIAKEEAIAFIKKRKDDPIGLVFFGAQAVSRCPLTLDRSVLEEIITETKVGDVQADGTVLAKGLITALNRLQKSPAKTKIIILLTDGEPSPDDLNYNDAILLAKKYGVKIYTIGIGGEYGGLYQDPFTGSLLQAGIPINMKLLELIAQKTGARSFLASNQKELHNIYETIDQLEKTEYETDVYHKYHDIFLPFLWALVVFLLIELLLATFVWFGL